MLGRVQRVVDLAEVQERTQVSKNRSLEEARCRWDEEVRRRRR